ncbi:MAG TPA: N-acetyltransferase [Porphyromonadaceae bacterium]|mgnify:FL=1|nr:N-acetyltransferase [Porphyromonadaceae bacterium]
MLLKIDGQISLRQLQLSDAEDIFHTIDSQRPYLGKWLPFVEQTKDLRDSEEFVRACIDKHEERLEYTFTIRKNDVFAGLIGLKDSDSANKKTEIGYWLSEPYQRQGIATQSVRALCDYAFRKLGFNRVQIKCAVGNDQSRSIPQRLGFQLEGIERQGELLSGNVFADIEIYSLLKNEFL